jgi:hypothetical protein
METESNNVQEVKACPFCGRELTNVVIDSKAGWAEHTYGTDCFFNGYEFDQFDLEKWNTRAS